MLFEGMIDPAFRFLRVGRKISRTASRRQRSALVRGAVQLFAEQISDVGDFVVKHIELARKPLNFRFGAAIDVVIELTAEPVFRVLTILAHHNDRRLNRGQHG